MNIAPATTNPFSRGDVAEPPKKELGKDDFLRLLTTQLSNQDPLKPVDNQAFIAQLAQFASVEQLNRLGTSLETLLVAQTSSSQVAAANLVGKGVTYRADAVRLPAEGDAKLAATLAEPGTVTVAIQDAAGRAVRTLALGRREAGAVDVVWDGRDETGQRLPPGSYRVVASANAADGAPLPLSMRAEGRVSGVAFGPEGPQLLVDGARVALADVAEIHQG
jgi:flagellar basal-body rod modification protein FlgD